eukprot:403360267
MNIIQAFFKHCAWDNGIMWFGLFAITVFVLSMMTYQIDKRKQEALQRRVDELKLNQKQQQKPEQNKQESSAIQSDVKQSLPASTSKVVSESVADDKSSVSKKAKNEKQSKSQKAQAQRQEQQKEEIVKERKPSLDERRVLKTDLLMKMSQNHRIEEDPQQEDQYTNRNSPIKVNGQQINQNGGQNQLKKQNNAKSSTKEPELMKVNKVPENTKLQNDNDFQQVTSNKGKKGKKQEANQSQGNAQNKQNQGKQSEVQQTSPLKEPINDDWNVVTDKKRQ